MKKKTSGTPADRLKIDGDWKQAIRKALAAKRPKDGWPKQQTEADGSPPRSIGGTKRRSA